ncbi:MAG TPA: S-adenosylmethionine decarboxylase [Alphaproteobacteria bacterium]|nr:S-adenosylmethionine decarboxylase [Alphaproteobacteria bacterium]
MFRFGEPTITTFGEADNVLGYSMTQFIETSLISGHFADEMNSAFIDIFSCKVYNPMKAVMYTRAYFEAYSCAIGVTFRNYLFIIILTAISFILFLLILKLFSEKFHSINLSLIGIVHS